MDQTLEASLTGVLNNIREIAGKVGVLCGCAACGCAVSMHVCFSLTLCVLGLVWHAALVACVYGGWMGDVRDGCAVARRWTRLLVVGRALFVLRLACSGEGRCRRCTQLTARA